MVVFSCTFADLVSSLSTILSKKSPLLLALAGGGFVFLQRVGDWAVNVNSKDGFLHVSAPFRTNNTGANLNAHELREFLFFDLEGNIHLDQLLEFCVAFRN